MNNEACIDTENDEFKKIIHEFSIREKVYIADIAFLKEQVRSMQVKLFGRSSEAKITLDDKQLNLFDTSEDELPITGEPDEEIEIPSYKRKMPVKTVKVLKMINLLSP